MASTSTQDAQLQEMHTSTLRTSISDLKKSQIKSEDVFKYGQILLKRALRSEAGAYFELAHRLQPEDFKIASALRLTKEIDELLKNANRAVSENRLPDAIRCYSSVLQLDTTNAALNGRILYQRSGVYLMANRLAEVDDDCKRCLGMLPNYQKARLRRIKVLVALNKLSEAREELYRLER